MESPALRKFAALLIAIVLVVALWIGGWLWAAGELYKEIVAGGSIAFENHRHFALRKPRSLRRSPAFLIPTGPFFDDWGARVARGLALPDGRPSEDTLEVIHALVHGWERLPRTVGYGRGLRGFRELHPELKIEGLTPAQRKVIETPREAFERAWAEAALRALDDIPSRA